MNTINNVPRELLPCPFCGETPELPSGDGTQYEIECGCGQASAGVQICDLMTIEERVADELNDFRYGEEFVERAKVEAIARWNTRAPSPADHVEDVRTMVVPSTAAAYAMGAKGGSVVDAERLAFESWMAGHCWALCAAWDGSGYRCESEQAGQFNPAAGMTRRLWAAWRDRAALATVCAAAPNIAPTSEHSGS